MLPRLALLGLAVVAALTVAAAQEAALERAAALTPIVERLCGHPFSRPPGVSEHDAEFFIEFFARLEQDPARASLLTRKHALWRKLRLIPPDLEFADLARTRPSTMAMYLPESHQVLVLVGAPEPEALIAHELVHAHRHLTTKYRSAQTRALQEDDDWYYAVTAAVEGDACLVGTAVALVARGIPEDKALGLAVDRLGRTRQVAEPASVEVPRGVAIETTSLYRAGVEFAAHVYRTGGMNALRKSLVVPPRSMEQVLHPDKYTATAPDEPTVFSGGELSDLVGERGRLVSTGTMGEHLLRALLAEQFTEDLAEAIAGGWDGCRYQLFLLKDGNSLLGAVSTWDTARDAAEFASGWCEWAGRRDGKEYEIRCEVLASGERRMVRTRDGAVVTVRRDRDVVVLDGLPDDMDTVPLLVRLWESTGAERSAADEAD